MVRVSGLLVLEVLQGRPLVKRKDLALRYGVSLRTIDNWKASRKLPRPKYINGPMWSLSDIAKFEEQQ
jgi:hypothetical protein